MVYIIFYIYVKKNINFTQHRDEDIYMCMCMYMERYTGETDEETLSLECMFPLHDVMSSTFNPIVFLL